MRVKYSFICAFYYALGYPLLPVAHNMWEACLSIAWLYRVGCGQPSRFVHGSMSLVAQIAQQSTQRVCACTELAFTLWVSEVILHCAILSTDLPPALSCPPSSTLSLPSLILATKVHSIAQVRQKWCIASQLLLWKCLFHIWNVFIYICSAMTCRRRKKAVLLEAKQPPVKTNCVGCVGCVVLVSLGMIHQEESKYP